MGKNALVSFIAGFITVVAFGVILEVMRRKGVDPIARLSDVVAPPTMAPETATPPGGAAAAQGSAASASVAS